MSNGYLVAAQADLATAHELGEGFELDVLEFAVVGDGALPMLANAANVGVLLSVAATRDASFYALVQKLSLQLPRAQLIVVDAEAPAMFGFFPQSWPVMPLDEALRRATELKRRREPTPPEPHAPVQAAPMEAQVQQRETAPPEPSPAGEDERARAITIEPPPAETAAAEEALREAPAPDPQEDLVARSTEALAAELDDVETPALPIPSMHVDPPPEFGGEPPTETPAPAPSAAQTYAEHSSVTTAPRMRQSDRANYQAGLRGGPSLTADASAFAPKKLRRETPELVRVVIYQPHQLKEVLKAARKIDPRAEAAPQGMRVGDVAVGESVGVSLDVRGASCNGAIQRRTWHGEPIDFSFTLEADTDVKQAVILARVFVGDAQVGVIAFTRPISGAAKNPASGDRLKLKRHKRVFLSYSSQDRATVSAIATAYEAAGIPYFWDRASLTSGEEWSPRLRKEIDKADLFHLCWSKAASKSEWVVTEAEHALTRRKRNNGKQPDITVQMLDGPPWAPHPSSLDNINFDDFVRAAVVGYTRGDGGDAA